LPYPSDCKEIILHCCPAALDASGGKWKLLYR